jgi:hypothetical protein
LGAAIFGKQNQPKLTFAGSLNLSSDGSRSPLAYSAQIDG